jgi:hypothetical protein
MLSNFLIEKRARTDCSACGLVPSGPPSLRSGVQLGLRPSCRTRLVVRREFEFKTSSPIWSLSVQTRKTVARPERFELPTSWFVARRSIQLSYGRKGREYYHIVCG